VLCLLPGGQSEMNEWVKGSGVGMDQNDLRLFAPIF
jgi:hypothetical protein